MSQFFAPGGQSIRVSASPSVLPKNTQDLLPFRLTGLISLQSQELSRVFSNTVRWVHKVVIISACTYIPSLGISCPFRSPQSTSRVPCAMQLSLVMYFIPINVYMSISLFQFTLPHPPPLIYIYPLGIIYVFSMPVSLFLLCKQDCLYLIFSDPT